MCPGLADNREPVQDEGPSGVALNCQLVGLWALSVAAMVRIHLFFGKWSQIRKKYIDSMGKWVLQGL